MSGQTNFLDILNATSSQASAYGLTPCAKPDGLMISRSGLDLAHASLSARQAKEKGLLTSGIYGPRSTGSSASVSLASSLVSRLQEKTASDGSTLWRLTWKTRATPAGRLISALRASGRHTSGSVSGGLPTPSGTSNHGKNHVAGRLDEWGGSSNPFRGTCLGKVHSPSFEAWMMGIPVAWVPLMRSAMQSLPRQRKRSSKATSK